MCFVFSLNTRSSHHLYRRLWMHEQDIPQKPWRGAQMNHLMPWLQVRKTSVEAENVSCAPSQPSSSSLISQLGGRRDGVASSLPWGLGLPLDPGWCQGGSEVGFLKERDWVCLEKSSDRVTSSVSSQIKLHEKLKTKLHRFLHPTYSCP